MKKVLAMMFALAVVAVPMAALAQGPIQECTLGHPHTDLDSACADGATVCDVDGTCPVANQTSAWGMCCIMDAVLTVTDWIFFILVAVVALLVIWGGFTIATAGGAPDKVNTGRNFIMYSMLGFAVALLARAIPSVVKALLGV